MPKQNHREPWRQILNDERGFHIAVDAADMEEQGESSNRPQIGQNASMNERNHQGEDRRSMVAYREQINDVLYVHPTDHSGMTLTTDLLTGKNFHSWSRSIRRGLVAKNKLDFIDGTMIEPDVNSLDYKQWLRVDYLVFSWIVNSITKELGRGFQHIGTSKDLWGELSRRFGRTNGPKIYKLRRELATYTQGNQSVLLYYNNLQAL
ncbi:hypothetical protein C2S52_008428 [Perilla frutescens var. hirtella]|nr:hypothetical protein C2S52_008428 [Perilla frutescens var. hirtella]